MKIPNSSVLKLFFAVSLAHLLAIVLQSQPGITLSKPLLLASLSLWFFLQTKNKPTAFSVAILGGLICSIAGDTLLLYNKPGAEQFFLYGLGSFLVTQLFYTYAFLNYPGFSRGAIVQNVWLAVPLLLFLLLMLWLLWDTLPEGLRPPVAFYAIVIVFMTLTCFNMKGRVPPSVFYTLISGALLFVLSDSLLALTKFKFTKISEVWASLAIMVTYLAGQYLIAKGAVKSFRAAP